MVRVRIVTASGVVERGCIFGELQETREGGWWRE